MESVKNKMESLIKERDVTMKSAIEMEGTRDELKDRKVDFEKKISKTEKDISKAEDGLDRALTTTRTCLEQLEEEQSRAADAEQQVQALVRKIQLLDEESQRVNERLQDTLTKLTTTEAEYEENERTRKVIDARTLVNEEKLELQECQLIEANSLAEEADRKYEAMDRKLRMIETEYERIVDRAEQFETKCQQFEVNIKTNNDRLKELEEVTTKNGEAEDEYEKTIARLTELYSSAEARAEFGERTVEKLEKTIDGLDDSLYQEKKHFQEISLKIDAMLGDMKAIRDMEAKVAGVDVENIANNTNLDVKGAGGVTATITEGAEEEDCDGHEEEE